MHIDSLFPAVLAALLASVVMFAVVGLTFAIAAGPAATLTCLAALTLFGAWLRYVAQVAR